MQVDFGVPPLFDYAATLTWAVSGALVGVRKNFDFTGVFVVALLSSTGGGLVRDAMFLQRTPAFLLDPVYLPLIAVTTLLITVFTVRLTLVLKGTSVRKIVDLIDALGTPAFAVIGMQLAEDRSIPTAGIILIGVVNGVAGGLLRDVVVRDVPALLRPGQFVTLTLAAVCGLFIVLRLHRFNPTEAALATVAAFFTARVLAVRFNWRSHSILGDSTPNGVEENLAPENTQGGEPH
jgi:uncharacterized membrane protein YeiH